MHLGTLIARSLRFHRRAHLGVILGAAVGTAALLGALVVGDSVRESLRRQALSRLGAVDWALEGRDRFFRSQLSWEWAALRQRGEAALEGRVLACALMLSATASRPDGSARANHVQLLGVDAQFDELAGTNLYQNIPGDSVILNRALANQLGTTTGDTILLRVRKPTSLSREAVVSPQSDATVAMRLTVHQVVGPEQLANFSLLRSQVPPWNAFVSLDHLQEAVGATGKGNLLLAGRPGSAPVKSTAGRAGESAGPVSSLDELLARTWTLGDAELVLQELPMTEVLELRSPRVFLDPPVVESARNLDSNAWPVLTYLVNQFRSDDRTTPYSMVTATTTPSPVLPTDLGPDEIIVNAWLAEDLRISPGAGLEMSYYRADSGASLVEQTNRFRVKAVVPMEPPYADRTLMPEFPGIARAESTHDWDAGFTLAHEIRAKDDDYWKQWRGTPKAFLNLEAGQRLWSNRFGNLTAMRFPIPEGVEPSVYRESLAESLLRALRPAELGLQFVPVRSQALAAVNQAQDFGQLFLSFSVFLVLAALILMALLFQFSLENRLGEIGTFLALGFKPASVRGMLLGEGAVLAFIGGCVGVAGGTAYALLLLKGLTTLWYDAVGTSALAYHARLATYLLGLVSAALISTLTIAWVLRRHARRPARELLASEAGTEEPTGPASSRGGWSLWVAAFSAMAGIGLMGWAATQEDIEAGSFFAAASLFLLAGLGATLGLLQRVGRGRNKRVRSLGGMGFRNMARQSKRSLASVALLACGSFLVIAVGANRLDASLKADRRESGTGGFALIGESSLPVLRDMNARSGREFYGLDERGLKGVSIVSLRMRDGDDASCLNLNRAQQPRLLGVNPLMLDQRGAFTFTTDSGEHPWMMLRENVVGEPDMVPAIGDANSIRWALNKRIGDTIDYIDERGRPFKVKLVGAVANSILQGSLLIDEAAFVDRFPSSGGYRLFLIDAPPGQSAPVASMFGRALADTGLELVSAVERLAAFNAVQNTYLDTFQVLGGLGLLLGSAGLGVVVMRNVLERRGELALLLAVGFTRRSLRWLVLSEHGALLCLGLVIGVASALAAILPVAFRPGSEFPWQSLVLTLGGVFCNGLIWTWAATSFALRGDLIPALRHE